MPEKPDGERWEIQRLGDEWAVYDAQEDSVHLLNRVAGAIWQKSRKGHTTSQILEDLVKEYPAQDRAQLAADVERTLQELRDLHLLEDH